MSDLLQVSDLERAKLHDTFHSEVITGKAGGLSTGANIDYATNAVTGQVQKTLPKVIDDLDWSYVGLFADGVTFTDKMDFAVDAVGTQWIYTGSLPFSATAGTVPSEPLYQAVRVNSLQQLSGLTEPSDLDQVHTRTFANVDAMLAFNGLQTGQRYSTGGTTWEYLGTTLGNLSDFKAITYVNPNDFASIEECFATCTNCIIDLSNRTYTLAPNGYLIAGEGVNVQSNGATIEQSTWGYPGLEIRYPNTKITGVIRFEYNGARTSVITDNTLGYAGWPSGNYKDQMSAILMNNVTGDPTGSYVEHVDVFGFINGVWQMGDNTRVNYCSCDTTDMGVTGGGPNAIGQSIGNVYHKNITTSQNVEGHSVYMVTSGAAGSLQVGTITVDDSVDGSSALKLHGYKNFYVNGIHGRSTGGAFNFREGATGVVNSIHINVTSGSLYFGINALGTVVDYGTKITVNSVVISSPHDAIVCPQILQVSSGGELEILNSSIELSTYSANQPSLALVSSNSSLVMHSPSYKASNSQCDNYVFNPISYDKCVITTPRVTNNGAQSVRLFRNTFSSGQSYTLNLDPNLISLLDDKSIICTAFATFNATFSTNNSVPFPVNGGSPNANFGTVFTAVVVGDIMRLTRTNIGQRITLINGGGANLIHNGASGLDGNFILKDGATIPSAGWGVVEFLKIGTNLVQV